jgi:antitoxin VapB
VRPTLAKSVETADADALARSLARLTGETMTEAVTVTVRERFDPARQRRSENLSAGLTHFGHSRMIACDTGPVTRHETDAAFGDVG